MAYHNNPLILYFAPWNYWERENRSQPLARAMAELGHQILYVNYPLGVRHKTRVQDLFHRSEFREIQPGLHMTVGGPWWALYRWPSMLYVRPGGASLIQKAFIDNLLGVLAKEPFKGREIIMLSSRMISQVLIEKVRPLTYALDIEDPWSHMSPTWGIEKPQLLEALKAFGAKADLAFANGIKIAKAATEDFLEIEPHILLNGVDLDRFKPTPGAARPHDYPAGQSVLFSGMVDRRIDFDLLKPAFKALPGVNFVFLGKVTPSFLATTNEISELHSNAYFLGHKEIDMLPAYLQQADMFMIPYVMDATWTRVFPAKLFEYFIFGKQTISSFPILDIDPEYRFALLVAPDSNSFISHLREGLSGCPRSEEIAAYGGQQGWSRRAALLCEHLFKGI